MCALNPKHSKVFRLEVFTSADIDEATFLELVRQKVVEAEVDLNIDMRLRWHIWEEGVKEKLLELGKEENQGLIEPSPEYMGNE